MAELDDDLDEVIEESIEFAGETVTIRSRTPGLIWEGSANVQDGAGEFDDVEGGHYQKITYTLTISKTHITFKPQPGDLAEVRAEELRIPSGGVTNRRRHYVVRVVGRDVPE